MRFIVIFCVLLAGCSTIDDKQDLGMDTLLALAHNGDREAIHTACYRFLYGKGIEQNYSEARFWCKRSAQANLSSGQTLLAEIYYHGLGVPVNFKTANYWYSKAAEGNHPHAMLMLFYIYIDGKGVDPDPALAYSYLKRAAELDYDKAKELLKELNKNMIIDV